jgi:hypothetical protein
MATLAERGLMPSVVLVNWRVPVSWTPYKPQGSVASSSALPATSTLANNATDSGKGWIATDTGHLHIWTGTAFLDVATPSTYNAKSYTIHCRASSSADALTKVKSRMAMQASYNTVTYGTPALGWIER